MTFFDIIFYGISAVILISASVAVFSDRIKPVYISAFTSLISITIIFFLLGSDYIAIMHLFIFTCITGGVIIFSLKNTENDNKVISNGSYIAPLIIAVFTALLAGNLISTKWKEVTPQAQGLSASEITGLIQTEYFLPMMLLAVIIFVGVIGSSYIAKRN